ncbi:MAG: hypothetical protein ABIN18_22100 [Pseudomonadota bacterium]
MESLKYTTQIEGRSLAIPEHILERLDKTSEVEVIFRPIRRSSPKTKRINQVIEEIERQMNKEFPNLEGPINHELVDLAGISHDTVRDLRKYSDKEILGMARMEKHLEKGEIIENLF